MKGFLKYLRFALLGVGVALLLAAALTQTPLARHWLRTTLEGQINRLIVGQLTIDAVEGNLFNSLELKGVKVVQNGDTILTVSQIKANYRLTEILSHRVHLMSLQIDSLTVSAHQTTDSVWNVPQFLSSSNLDTTSSTWSIEADEVQIKNAQVQLAPLDSNSFLPRRISNIKVTSSFSRTRDGETIGLKHIEFSTEQPSVHLRDGSCVLNIGSSHLELQRMRLETTKNTIEARGVYGIGGDASASLSVKTGPLDLSEFRDLIAPIDTLLHPTIQIEATKTQDSLHAEATLGEDREQVNLLANVTRLSSERLLSAEIAFQRLDLNRWVRDAAPATDLNGSLNIKGALQGEKERIFTFEGALNNSKIASRRVNSLRFSGRYAGGGSELNLRTSGPVGQAKIYARVSDLSSTPRYHARVITRRLNLAQVSRADSLVTDLNASVDLEGQGFDRRNAAGSFSIAAEPSTVMGVEVDSIAASGRFGGEDLIIEKLHLDSPMLMLDGGGYFSLRGRSHVEFHAACEDLGRWHRFVSAESLAGTSRVQGVMQGGRDSLEGRLQFGFDSLFFDGLRASMVQGSAQLKGSSRHPMLDGMLKAEKITVAGRVIDSAAVTAHYGNKISTLKASVFSGDTLRGDVDVEAVFDSAMIIVRPDLRLRLYNSPWITPAPFPTISLSSGHIETKNFSLVSGDQSIAVDGSFDRFQGLDEKVNLHNFRLSTLKPFLQLGRNLDGNVDLDLSVGGTLTNPRITASMSAAHLQYGDDTVGSVSGTGSLEDSVATWKLLATFASGNTLTTDGILPLTLHRPVDVSIVDTSRKGYIHLAMPAYDLSRVRGLPQTITELKGILSTDLTLSTVHGLTPLVGYLTLKGGSAKSRTLGLDYPEITLDIRAETSRVTLKQLQLTQQKGSLRITGVLDSVGNVLTGENVPLRATVRAKEFEIGKSKNYQLAIDADIGLNNMGDRLNIDGDITVLRSRWYLAAYMKQFQKSQSKAARPMLVAASGLTDTTTTSRQDTTTESAILTALRKVKGRLKIHMPRNSSLDGPNLHTEIISELEVQVADSLLSITGTIEIQRGWVQAYGVRFNFKEGKLTFKGGDDPIPSVHMILEYKYRDPSREEKTLVMNVDGYAKDPLISFTVDGKSVTEKDAVSIVVLGYTSTDVTGSQAADVDERANQLVDQLTSAMLSARLSSTVGRSLGLDVVDVRGEESWSKVSLTAGKYVTDRLLVTYEKGFGDWESGEAEPQTLTLEYELFKFLFLQLVRGSDTRSGADILIKLQ